MSAEKEKSLTSKVLAGAGWAVSMRWAIKLLGLVSSAILARILMPEDYGLVAIAMIALGLTQVLFEFGVETALVQNHDATREHFNTAWTMRIIQSLIVTLVLLAFAPYSAGFFDEPRMPLILQLVSLSVFIQGFENIGVVVFRKELQFGRDFQFYVLRKLVGVVITIALAYYLRSYFALVFGMIAQSVVNVAYSYRVVDFRPRFSLRAFHDLWNFSKWLVVKGVSDYINEHGAIMFLSKLTSVRMLGLYKWGGELSNMSTSEIVYPMLRSLMPGLVKVKTERKRLESAFLTSTAMIAIVAIPLGLGFSSVSAEFIPLFLGGGDKWSGVVPIAQILAYAAVLHSLYIVAVDMLIVIGHIRLTAYLSWMRTVLVLALMYPAFQFQGVTGVAATQVLIGVVATGVIYAMLVSRLAMRPSRVLGIFWRPAVAGALMAAALYPLDSSVFGPLLVALLAKVLVGALIYGLALGALWWLSGRPDSAERKLFGLLEGQISRRFAARR